MFNLDLSSRTPIYEQLYNNVVRLISSGALKAGDKLPPVRALACDLSVNPNTVSKAYKLGLTREEIQNAVNSALGGTL